MCCRLQLMILFLNSKILYCFFYYKFKCFPKNQVKQCNIIYVLVWSCIISYIAPISSSLIEQDCCYQCCLYIRFLFYTSIHFFFSPALYCLFQLLYLANPKDKQLRLLGVRQNHSSLQILVQKTQGIRVTSACWKTSDFIVQEKGGEGGIHLQAFTEETQDEKHVTEIENWRFIWNYFF